MQGESVVKDERIVCPLGVDEAPRQEPSERRADLEVGQVGDVEVDVRLFDDRCDLIAEIRPE
jgi:hypothetical protein